MFNSRSLRANWDVSTRVMLCNHCNQFSAVKIKLGLNFRSGIRLAQICMRKYRAYIKS